MSWEFVAQLSVLMAVAAFLVLVVLAAFKKPGS